MQKRSERSDCDQGTRGEADSRAEPPASGQMNLSRIHAVSGLERSDRIEDKKRPSCRAGQEGQITSMDTAKQQASKQAQLQAQ
jgi:hypothetical protein